jgi:putative spermidine/putrescine transport system ATP-binding protein
LIEQTSSSTMIARRISDAMQHSLSLTGVGKNYAQVTALHPTDLEVKAGEFLTLLGPSGSGKTTLLMAIAGFVEPSCGRMELDGKDITRIGPEHRNFGVVFQGYALFPHMSVWDNVWFPLRARNISRRDARASVEETLDLMELSAYARRMPKELSGGQQQRVALARALIFKPELLLLDEPLSALDKALRKTLQTELKALHRKVGTTFIYVTHDQEEALSMSDRIAILRDGRIKQIDAPEALYHNPDSRFVAGFLGRSNFIEGDIVDVSGQQARVRTAFGEITGQLRAACDRGSRVFVAIRPEMVSVSTQEPATGNRARGTVAETTFLGSYLDLEIDVAGVRLAATLAANHQGDLGQYRTGAPVWFGWNAASALVLAREDGRP